jgi:hypothetical protein
MNRSIVFAALVSLAPTALLAATLPVVNAGFEDVQPIVDGGVAPGIWFGNIAQMVTAENGVTPTEGTHMVKYLEASNTSNLREAIDVSSLPSGITVTLSADVFRLPGTPGNTDFQLAFAAIDHAQPTFDNSDFDTHTLGRSFQTVPEGVWTNIFFSTVIPTGTVLFAVEVSYESRGVIPGGYADNVQLTSDQIPEPSGVVLAAVGLIGLVVWRRRKR